MKRTALLLVAILGLVVASAVQAAEVNVKFYSQVGNAPVDVADDVRFTLMSAEDGTVVFDSATAESADIAEGVYTVVAEQPSTHLFGSVEVAFSDADEAKKLFLLSNEGLAELEGAHECDNEGHCDCDENCICRLINHNCTERVSGCDDNIAIANVPATLQTAPATQPVYPQSTYPQSTYPQNYGMPGGGCCCPPQPTFGGAGTLGILGAMGAIIAVALADDDPAPVSAILP